MSIVTGEIYHIYTKSIAEFVIFNNDPEFLRIKELISYYNIERHLTSFSRYKERDFQRSKKDVQDGKRLIQIICYCFMPTHIHLVLKQLKDNGISDFMMHILNSHTRYFNIKHNRKGPLWESKFKKVLVDSDEQLLHLTRYIHLNPVTACIVNKPEEWRYSSYNEYVSDGTVTDGICEYKNILDINSFSYKKFVENRISYQRELAKIKGLMLD